MKAVNKQQALIRPQKLSVPAVKAPTEPALGRFGSKATAQAKVCMHLCYSLMTLLFCANDLADFSQFCSLHQVLSLLSACSFVYSWPVVCSLSQLCVSQKAQKILQTPKLAKQAGSSMPGSNPKSRPTAMDQVSTARFNLTPL